MRESHFDELCGLRQVALSWAVCVCMYVCVCLFYWVPFKACLTMLSVASDCGVKLYDDWWVVKWEGCGRNWSWFCLISGCVHWYAHRRLSLRKETGPRTIVKTALRVPTKACILSDRKRYYTSVCLQGSGSHWKSPVRIAGLWADLKPGPAKCVYAVYMYCMCLHVCARAYIRTALWCLQTSTLAGGHHFKYRSSRRVGACLYLPS